MGHNVTGLIAKLEPALVTPDSSWVVAPLGQGFVLAVRSDQDLTPRDPIPAVFLETATAIGSKSPVAYVVTCYFGGIGEQAAAVWAPSEHMEYEIGEGPGPINRALRLIGVQSSDAYDEFDAAGLQWFRSNDAWIEFSRSGKAGWQREAWPAAAAAWNAWKKRNQSAMKLYSP
jgi:hypothetical protein